MRLKTLGLALFHAGHGLLCGLLGFCITPTSASTR